MLLTNHATQAAAHGQRKLSCMLHGPFHMHRAQHQPLRLHYLIGNLTEGHMLRQGLCWGALVLLTLHAALVLWFQWLLTAIRYKCQQVFVSAAANQHKVQVDRDL